MHIASTIQQVRETKSQNTARVNAANKGTNNNANNNAAVAQSTVAKTDTVTLSKKSVTLAAKTATKSEPNVEKAFGGQSDEVNFGHRLRVAPVTKETVSQSLDNGTISTIGDAGEGSGSFNAVSFMSSISNGINEALENYKDTQAAKEQEEAKEVKEAAGILV